MPVIHATASLSFSLHLLALGFFPLYSFIYYYFLPFPGIKGGGGRRNEKRI